MRNAFLLITKTIYGVEHKVGTQQAMLRENLILPSSNRHSKRVQQGRCAELPTHAQSDFPCWAVLLALAAR